MSAHTPGPWVWLGEPGKSTLNAAHGEVLNYTGYENLTPAAYDEVRDAANMCLIASAPEMLDALRELVATGAYNPDGLAARNERAAALDKARAAIAKATGERA